MACIECGCEESEYNDRLGERLCLDCGLVLVVEPFEQSVSRFNDDVEIISRDFGRLGTTNDGIPRHIKKGLHFCNMALNAVAPQIKIHDRVAKLYVEVHNKGIFTSSSLEDRASAIVFYALKENNTPFSMVDVCSEYSSNPKHVKKIVRRINQIYRNANCANTNHEFSITREASKFMQGLEFENACKKVLNKLEANMDELYFTRGKSYYASICWMATLLSPNIKLTQKEIAKQTGFSAQSINKKSKELCVLLGFRNTDEMKGKINEL
jgi:transcription initiation factor TFIIIB Brf1 subunit/transcription initiation factor TFIIB